MVQRDRSIVAVTTVSHAMVHTYELSIPIFMTIWLHEYAVTEFFLGNLVGLGYALFGVGAVPSGVFSDRVGSGLLLRLALLGMGGSFIVLSLVPGTVGIGLALLLWGASASVHHPASLSLISRSASERGSVLAYHGMAGNLGIALGPLTTTLLLSGLPWRSVSALLGLPALLAALLSLRTGGDSTSVNPAPSADDETRRISGSGQFLGATRRLFLTSFALVFLLVLTEGLYYRGVLTFLPRLFEGMTSLGEWTMGFPGRQTGRYLYSAMLMVGILGQYAGGKLSDRVMPENALMGGVVVLGLLALVFIPVARGGLGPVIATVALLGVALFFVQPLYQAAIADHTPPGTRGLAYGFTYLGIFGIGAAGAPISGYLLTEGDFTGVFVFMAGLAGVGLVLTVMLKMSRSGEWFHEG